MQAPVSIRERRGFTLIELLVVIAIIALLIGILIPALSAASRAAKKVKDSSQVSAIEKAMFNWASSYKENQFPPLRTPGNPNTFGGDIDAAFETLLNGPSTHLTSVSTDPLPPAMFICPMSGLSVMVPYGVDPATGLTNAYNDQSFYDGPIHCSYGVLNSGQLNSGTFKGNNEGRNNNGRATVPLVYNALNYVWLSPNGHQICDWNRVATGNADDWKGHIGWADGHVKFSETPKVPTVMNGKTYTSDNLNEVDDAANAPNNDAVMGIPTSAGGKLASTSADWQDY